MSGIPHDRGEAPRTQLPTGRRLEVPHVGVIAFEDDKIASEHIYWDHASVLIQLGVLDGTGLPALGSEQTERLLDPTIDSAHASNIGSV